ncbi:Transposon Tf2-11 polyprotein [Thelohanellus kitauei]|uniref:Transposon Tf2-11 polyprotein n=1 Tax=Thelohanellus kitauei TaxID=669202 RepID=A0A0C2I5V5_THEKT|nr:Transposon Tf2-11 polyprotein [Thelohanellus kitauei]
MSRTTPCHTSGNGLVERQNRKIKEMLRHHVNSDRSDWDEHLHKVLLATRIAKHPCMGFSPEELTYGKQLRSGANVKYPNISNHTSVKLSNHEAAVEKLINTKAQLEDRAKVNQTRTQHYPKKLYDKKVDYQYYSPGNLVMIKCSETGKLSFLFIGPFVILDNNHQNYTIVAPQKISQHYHIHHDYL